MPKRHITLVSDTAWALVLAVMLLLPMPATAGRDDNNLPDVWIVQLHETPYALTLAHSAAVDAQSSLSTPAMRAELMRIERSQADALAAVADALGRDVDVGHRYRFALVGFAARLREHEATVIARLPQIARVIRNTASVPPTLDPATPMAVRHTRQDDAQDPVVDLIGADRVWDGSATGDDGHFGEGIIVGVTGTGISGDHPAFAAIGDDGYAHVNPLGSGVYIGECLATTELTCNDKLIGRRNLTSGRSPNSEDEDGYSTFVTSLAAGNRLFSGASLGTPLVTGIAPHANVIAYKTCAQSCLLSDVLMAFDHAIADGVDVLLHTVGSPGGSPWDGVVALAARSLHAAGVSLAYLAGSNGPAPGSVAHSLAAPWVATFGTSTHGRAIGARLLEGFTGGDGPPPAAMPGQALSGTYSGPIVYAGAHPNPNAPGSDPAQCLTPYPPEFFAGEIVVCDRGQIPYLLKSVNVQAGGAGGFVLANVSGGIDTLATATFALPAIHLQATDAATLRAWLATGGSHQARIAHAPHSTDPNHADLLATYSARGPLLQLDVLVPSLTAPSVGVVGADIGVTGFAYRAVPGSAPGAGALALIKSVRPDWTAAEVLSALMTTGVAPLREMDQMTATGPFDHGGGRIDVAAAAQAGLVLNVTAAEFAAANPAVGGEPANLNLAGLVELNCVGHCSWTRHVRATRAGTWQATGRLDDPGVELRVAPLSFTLQSGEIQELTISLNAPATDADGPRYGEVVLDPEAASGGMVPPSRLMVAVNWLADGDGDGIANALDNCLELPNGDQRDTNGDGYGNRCDTDLNNDGITNVVDLAILRLRLFSADGDADFDGDGTVGQSDVHIMATRFFQPPGPAADPQPAR